jgi:catechol 2,3-dioxygenase-like lactoylglutathione lyase family enzyme
MEINGVAHTFITVGNFAAGRAFYGQLLPFLGLTVVADTVNTFYCVGGRTGFGIHAPAEEYVGQRFRQGSSDYITIAFVLVSALMSMRRMTS